MIYSLYDGKLFIKVVFNLKFCKLYDNYRSERSLCRTPESMRVSSRLSR